MNDIVTDGVSLVSSYRSPFMKIVKKDGFPVLITKMKERLAKGDVWSATSTLTCTKGTLVSADSYPVAEVIVRARQ